MTKKQKTLVALFVVVFLVTTVFAFQNTSNFMGNLMGLRNSTVGINQSSTQCIDFNQLNLSTLAYTEKGITSSVASDVVSVVNSRVPSIVTTEVSTIVTSVVPSDVVSSVSSNVALDVRCFELTELVDIYKFVERDLRNDITQRINQYRKVTDEIRTLNNQIALQTPQSTSEVINTPTRVDTINNTRQPINAQGLQRTNTTGINQLQR